jgi:WD40 repeat protein
VLCLAFAADGKTLASVSWDKTIRLWDVGAGRELQAHPIKDSSRNVDSAAFSPGARVVAWGGLNDTIHFLEIGTGKELHPTIGHQAPVTTVAFSSDGRVLTSVSWDGTLRRWDPATGMEQGRHRELKCNLYSVALTPDGRQYIRLYGAFLSHDGRLLATAEAVPAGQGNPIRLWDVAAGKELRSITGHTDSVVAIAIAPDGRTLASGSWDKTVRVWDVATGNELHRLAGAQDEIYCVRFSPDGRWLASGGKDRMLRLWDAATGRQLHQFQHECFILAVAFSPDSRTLASGGWNPPGDRTGPLGIHLWEVATGQERRRLCGHRQLVTSLDFSPDGRLLASGSAGGDIRLWAPTSGQEVRRLSGGQQGLIRALAFSDDGKRPASGAADSTVLIWDVAGFAPRPVTALVRHGELETLWKDLASPDASRAYQAMGVLITAPVASVPFLKGQLRPVAPADARQTARWAADLDSDDFVVREKATAELARLGELAAPVLRKALDGQPSAEVRSRAGRLLDALTLGVSPDQVRALRAVEVLEQAGTSEARLALTALAKGAPEARLTREAKASLERLTKRLAAAP